MAKAKKTGDGKFEWNPASFEIAKHHVDLARACSPPIGAALAQIMPNAILTMGAITGLGGLSCPPPSDDPEGTYRVGLDGGKKPEIQRKDQAGNWLPVP